MDFDCRFQDAVYLTVTPHGHGLRLTVTDVREAAAGGRTRHTVFLDEATTQRLIDHLAGDLDFGRPRPPAPKPALDLTPLADALERVATSIREAR